MFILRNVISSGDRINLSELIRKYMTWKSTSYAGAWMVLNKHITDHLKRFVVKDTYEVIRGGIKTRVIYFNIPQEVKKLVLSSRVQGTILPDSEAMRSVYRAIVKYFKTKDSVDILEEDYTDLVNYIVAETGMQKPQVESTILRLAKEGFITIEDLGLTKIVKLKKSKGVEYLFDLIVDILKKYGRHSFLRSKYDPPFLILFGSFTGEGEKELKYTLSINTQDNSGFLTLKIENAEIRIPFMLSEDYPLELLPLPKKYFFS